LFSALLLAAAGAYAGQGASSSTPPPYQLRSTSSNQSMGAMGANLNDITQRGRDALVGVVGDVDCSQNGGALTGATEKGGFIFGGSCTPISSSGGSVSTTTFCVWIASQDVVNTPRMRFDASSWFGANVFKSSVPYTFELYAVAASSTSGVYANINCSNSGESGKYKFGHSGASDSSGGYASDWSGATAAYAFPLWNEFGNTQQIQASGRIDGAITFEAFADTMTVRYSRGAKEGVMHAETQSEDSTVGFQNGRYDSSGLGWRSICFDQSSQYYNYPTTRDRSFTLAHVDVWQCPKNRN
jgi:hypothetical protein